MIMGKTFFFNISSFICSSRQVEEWSVQARTIDPSPILQAQKVQAKTQRREQLYAIGLPLFHLNWPPPLYANI